MNQSAKAMLLVCLAAFLLAGVSALHPFGVPTLTDVDDYYVANAQPETGSNSAVTPIVFDYRGFDTLGEATVLYTTVAAVLAVFRGVSEK